MPRQEHVLSVFVASPGDVADERTRLEEVIRELNTTWSRELSVRLDLLQWETHAYPGISDDAQAVINEQIPGDYDLFVGIMWCRYGTPTGRAGSGTVEEFERAKARYEADSSRIKLMVYFKDQPIPPSRLDPSQLAKVNEFRESLGKEGVLYWNFSSVEQFEKLIRLHLTRQVQSWKAQCDGSEGTVQTKSRDESPEIPESETEEDDLGILDLGEIVEERFQELKNISERVGRATEDLGHKMTERTKELNALPRDSQGSINRKDAKRSICKAAADMDHYTARIEAELPLFRDALNTGMNALIRMATMSLDFDRDGADVEQAKEGLEAIVILRGVLTSTQDSTNEFCQTIRGLPRMTSELNRAKRRVVSVLDRLMAEFTNGETLLREAEATVRDLLGEGNNA
jgi:hypothetical protein